MRSWSKRTSDAFVLATRLTISSILPRPFSGEIHYDSHGKLLPSLRGTEFAGEECRVLPHLPSTRKLLSPTTNPVKPGVH